MKAGRVLIVEDDPLWQEFLQEPLADEYLLTVVSTPAEAKAALDTAQAEGNPFGVVTVDIGLTRGMPSLDGEDILAFVNQHHRGTKCIVVTGHQDVNTTRLRNYFKEFDVFDYISKAEFNFGRLKELVDQGFYFHGYQLLAEVGRGGMGTVYKALDPQNNRLVAVKVLHPMPNLPREEVSRRLARFNQEVQAIRRLEHPNIVTVYDYYTTKDVDGQVFFVMEYLAGRSLEFAGQGQTRLPLPQVLEIGLQLCEALAYAHSQQVIHRDIKPSNLMLMADGCLKVTDFGIAKMTNNSMPLTRTEEIIGTLDYMPPEQILQARTIDHRVDIYATGVVLYELLAGQRPYSDPLLKLQQEAPPLLDYVPDVPEPLATLIMAALARHPGERPQTALALAETLKTVAG